MKSLKYALFVILFLYSNTLFSKENNIDSIYIMQNVNIEKMDNWVDSVFSKMSIYDKASQFIMPIIWLKDKNSIDLAKKRLKKEKWGGILFQKTNIETQAKVTRELQQISHIPLFIALDGEWGLYMRIKDAPRFPRNMGLGNVKYLPLLYKYAREVARECRLMGIHIDFAPDLDVNIDPRNPVIGTRSFGNDKNIVAKCGNAFSKGLEDGGVLSVAKHFPGHGDTHTDSHKALPLISVSKQRLDTVELYPFKSYIKEGFSGIMVGHLNVPALDNSDIPSSMSKKIITDLLKGELKFKGLIFTDALEMNGANIKGNESAGLKALKAGADILLGPPNSEKLITEIVESIKNKTLNINDINDRIKKILRYKYLLIESKKNSLKDVGVGDLSNKIWTKETKALQDTLWLKSITNLYGDTEEFLQNINPNKTVNVFVGKNISDKYISFYRNKGINNIYWINGREKTIIKELSKYHSVIFHITDFNAINDNSILSIINKKPSIIFCYGSPFNIKNNIDLYKNVKGISCVYESCIEAQKAVFTYISSILTNNENKFYKKKVKEICRSSMSNVVSLAEEGVKEGAYPGCQLFFSDKGNILIEKSFGTKTNKKDSVSNNTIYDLASLTKALATTPAMMVLVSEHKIKLNDIVAKYLPNYSSSPIGNITIQKLLFHESGLPSGLPFYEDLIDNLSYNYPLISNVHIPGYVSIWKNAWGNPNFTFLNKYISTEKKNNYYRFSDKLWINKSFKNDINDRIANTKLKRIGHYRYSDLNFYLLQQIIEKVSGIPLDVFVENKIYKPLGCHLTFNPRDKGIPSSYIAPSQIDQFLRKEELRGNVDDELAACLGGVSGNAGLFGSVDDVAKMCKMFLNNGKSEDGKTIISSNVLNVFITKKSNHDLRFLGFDKPSKKRHNVTAESASFSTFGHTGFTGSCFWVDPLNKAIFIFLSNRTYPNRNNTKLISENYRTRLQQLCYDAVSRI